MSRRSFVTKHGCRALDGFRQEVLSTSSEHIQHMLYHTKFMQAGLHVGWATIALRYEAPVDCAGHLNCFHRVSCSSTRRRSRDDVRSFDTEQDLTTIRM